MLAGGPRWEPGAFASTLALVSSDLLATFAFLELCNLGKGWQPPLLTEPRKRGWTAESEQKNTITQLG